MPWSHPDLMSLRLEFVAEAFARRRPIAALCAQYGISEKTGYKWLARFRVAGPAGLDDRAHAPRHCPHQTPVRQRELLVAARAAHPRWGARKLRAALAAAHPDLAWPAPSTITTLLHRAGLVLARRRRGVGRRIPATDPLRGPMVADQPNALWTLDYKGQFRLADGRWCYPLTIVDAASRFLLACVAHSAPDTCATQRALRQCFRQYGLPRTVLSDNGPPFASAGTPRGFSRLSCWLITFGIQPRFIVPGHPEHNGRHERLHRTLKAETVRPPAASPRAQQQRFDAFRAEYNAARPHEALGLVPPGAVYTPSPQRYVARPPPLAYPAHFLQRRVTPAGLVWWHQTDIYVSQTLAGMTLGLEPIAASHWDVYLAEYLLGTLDRSTLRFMPLTHRSSRTSSPINPV